MANPSALPDLEVAGLALDSRRVAGGELFLACPGTRLDGRAFIGDALARSAAMVAYDPQGFDYDDARAPGVAVPGLAGHVSEIAARFYGRPSRDLYVIGVTGTNGKTSCVHFLAQALERLDVPVRTIGTLGSGEVRRLDTSELTTPSPVDLQRLMREFVDDGATHVVMEVSSHALKQGRAAAVDFDAAVFTNLTRDHLDYHTDIDDYAAAKRSLFLQPSLCFAVVNADDPVGRRIRADAGIPVVGFGEQGEIKAGDVQVCETGLVMRVAHPRRRLALSVALVGRVNVSNVLAVAGVLLEMGFDPDKVERALNRLAPVPGRMELFRAPREGPTVVVDYAHTPDALERALQSVREHCRAELWCVFGCGGDRDRGKRPEMGRIAEQFADRVIVTNDNPRSESPAGIAADIVAGMAGEPEVILDRRRAIAMALESARPGDWVLIAGKGHETSQTIGDVVTPFDDREVVSGCLGKAA
jgi:UDP-N-acetylmuramoyl-L-alanyl-D-glutamate--2,6-diaminopimelate ligase